MNRFAWIVASELAQANCCLSVTPFFSENGELEGHIGMAQDITEKRIEINQMEHDVVTMYTALVSECTESADLDKEDPFLVHMRLSDGSASSGPASEEPRRKSRL